MREMQALRAPATKPADVVLGPCPGCDSWQVDYTDEVAQTYVQVVYDPDEPLGRRIDVQPFYDVIEDALREHAEECPHLRDLIEAYG